MVEEHGQSCQARISILCEVNHGIIIDARIEPLKADERTIAKKHIEYFEELKGEKDIVIFDRGYPSKELIEMLDNRKIKYLMRVSKSFNKEIDNTNEEDFQININYNNKVTEVRVIKVILDTGEIEMLITNLRKDEFKAEEFKELYFKRWSIETKYNTVKNKLKIETFSGKTKTSVEQDFYATMYLSNIVSISKLATDEEIKVLNKDKELKYEYQTNENVLIGKLKDKFVLALLIDNKRKRTRIINKILEEAMKNRSPIKPDRHYKRTSEDNRCYRKRRTAVKRFTKTSL